MVQQATTTIATIKAIFSCIGIVKKIPENLR